MALQLSRERETSSGSRLSAFYYKLYISPSSLVINLILFLPLALPLISGAGVALSCLHRAGCDTYAADQIPHGSKQKRHNCMELAEVTL